MSRDPVEVEPKIDSDGAGKGKGEEVARQAGEPGISEDFREFFRRGVGRVRNLGRKSWV